MGKHNRLLALALLTMMIVSEVNEVWSAPAPEPRRGGGGSRGGGSRSGGSRGNSGSRSRTNTGYGNTGTGSSSRGSSGSRAQSNANNRNTGIGTSSNTGYNKNTGTGYNNKNTYNSNKNSNQYTSQQQTQRNSYVNKNTVTQGGNTFSKSKSGIGSMLRSNKVKTALAAAAAGYLTYKAGKGILKGAAYLAHGGNRYYYDRGMYNNHYGSGQGAGARGTQCSYNVPSNDQQFGNMWYDGGSNRVQVLYFQCRAFEQYCCGMECCDYQYGGRGGAGRMGSGLVVLFVVLIVAGCCLCCLFAVLYKFFRSMLDCVLGEQKESEPQFGNVAYSSGQEAPYSTEPPTYNDGPPAYPSQPNYPQVPQTYPAQPPTIYNS